MNTKQIKKDIGLTLLKSIKESFQVIPKGSEIKRLLKEEEFPFSFEVPFVLKDDLESIVTEINKIVGIENKYLFSFKENTNTLTVRSADQATNDSLSAVINNLQIYGTTGNNQFPLGVQDSEETDNEVEEAVAEVIATGTICPTCGEAETRLMGESIRFCPFCTTLFESRVCKEDMLIEPKTDKMKAKIVGNDPEEQQPEDAPLKAIVEEGDIGVSTANVAEIPSQFSTKQKSNMKKGEM